MYKLIIRPLLFLLSAENAHRLAMNLLSALALFPGMTWFLRTLFDRTKAQDHYHLFGLTFPNRVGLAAGFDKDGKHIKALSTLGFGFIEVGTVTPRPQKGNPRPRLFRLSKSQGLINRMGFNNEGCDALAERLRKHSRRNVVIGANIGKNKDTPNDQAAADYIRCLKVLQDYVDYFVINVSSPNTPGLRELQEKGPLKTLLSEIQQVNLQSGNPRPLLLKIAPDLNDGQLDDIIEIALDTDLAGIVATNTTIGREGLRESTELVDKIGAGGLSGQPIREVSNEVLRKICQRAGDQFAVIGVGGIFSAADARTKLDCGADLVQVYTGFIYEGPTLPGSVAKSIRRD